MSYDSFPFNNWAKLMRRSLLDEESNFFEAPDPLGDISLRRSISKYLSQYRGLDVNPDNIIVGAGMEYLYGLLISIIGRDKLIAVEDPGYKKAQMVFEANGSTCIRIPVDEEGMEVDRLGDKDISLVHVTPSHHFPLGFVMSAGRKHKLISWANAMDAYILEDDYDSDFRFKGRPISALASIDSKRVVYMNTFTKTLARSIRMAYMVLPDSLMKKYRENLEFYSSTVTVFEQRTLAYFIENGFYERHINRMRSRYKKSRDDMINCLSKSKLSSICRVFDEGIGLHFIIKVDTNRSDEDIKNDLLKDGIKIKSVLDYCEKFSNKYNHMFIINYLETKEINIINAYDKIYEKCSLK